jgi:ubiquinone/menaquinone biosynthesis C-methylase UbiE
MKAKKAGPMLDSRMYLASHCRFPIAKFDVVLTAIMLHHLSKEARRQLVGEIRRVLKPSGRILAIDFGQASRDGERLIDTSTAVTATLNSRRLSRCSEIQA